MKKIIQDILSIHEGEYVASNIEKIPGGYLADAYKVTARDAYSSQEKHFFLKSVKTKDALANELPEDLLHSYLVGARANRMAETNCPQTYGCFIGDENDVLQKIDFHEASSIYELQEFREGEQLLPMLKELMKQGEWNDDIEECINSVVLMLTRIHAVSSEYAPDRAAQVYKRSVRDVLCHPELTLSVFSNNLQDSEIFKDGFKYEYIADMLRLFDACTDGSRLTAIHGDFWYSNIMLDPEHSPFLIDYSRQGYGEPGIDVGWFFGSMMWLSIVEKNPLYAQVASYFVERYKVLSGDKEIEKYAAVPLGFIGAVCSIEAFYPDVTNQERRKFVDFVHGCITMQTINHTLNF
jgi:hypothetical protein